MSDEGCFAYAGRPKDQGVFPLGVELPKPRSFSRSFNEWKRTSHGYKGRVSQSAIHSRVLSLACGLLQFSPSSTAR